MIYPCGGVLVLVPDADDEFGYCGRGFKLIHARCALLKPSQRALELRWDIRDSIARVAA